MNELPLCRWGDDADAAGRRKCGSPKVAAPKGIDPAFCAVCWCRDHEPGQALPPPAPPPALVQVGTALAAAARFAAAGMPRAENREARLKVCEGCEHQERGRCRLCGCFVAHKAAMATEQCPAGKWPNV